MTPEVCTSPPVSVTVGERHQEKSVPEVDQFDGPSNQIFWTYLRAITTRSRNLASKGGSVERSRGLRRTRNKLKQEYYSTPKHRRHMRKEIIAEAHTRDELELQFLNQGEVNVYIPGLGTQTSRYTIVYLPESQKPAEALGRPPIIFIPGISNDIVYGIDLICELARSGRRVISIGYPESTLGNITYNFTRACEESDTYEPHTIFFKAAITEIAGAHTPFELWGHSTGSAIIGEILTDEQFARRVTDAVLLSPASSVNQSVRSQNFIGIPLELRDLIHNLPEYSRFSFTPQGQGELKNKVYQVMRRKVCTKMDYSNSRVSRRGKIVVISGQKDTTVKSSDAEQDFKKNPQVTFINWPDAYHATPMMKPELTVAKVNEALKAQQ